MKTWDGMENNWKNINFELHMYFKLINEGLVNYGSKSLLSCANIILDKPQVWIKDTN